MKHAGVKNSQRRSSEQGFREPAVIQGHKHTHTVHTHTWTHMKLTMRRMVDILLCPPPRERSPSFIYWEPNKKEKKKWSGFLLSFQCLFLSGMNRQENGSDQRFMIRWNILKTVAALWTGPSELDWSRLMKSPVIQFVKTLAAGLTK